MTKSKFGITEDGEVFLINGSFRKLGHISHLTAARTPLAREVQQWWREQMEADEPIENLIEVREKGNGKRQWLSAEAEPTPGAVMKDEPVEALAAG